MKYRIIEVVRNCGGMALTLFSVESYSDKAARVSSGWYLVCEPFNSLTAAETYLNYLVSCPKIILEVETKS
jgi:hypothetical protein